MMPANKNGIIEYMYYDYDTQATRGWIFEITATDKDKYMPGGVPQKNALNAVP